MSENIEEAVLLTVLNLQGKIQKRVGSALSVHGIGLSEYLVLNELYLAAMNKMRRSDLAERVGLSPSGVTRLLNPMEKIGLVEKEENPRDARVSLVSLSAAGKQVYEEARISFGHAAGKLLESFDAKQLNTFSGLLKIVS